MNLAFAKMHGIGNDFVLVDHLAHGAPSVDVVQEAARFLCDRHFGIGADGVLSVLPPDAPDTDFAYRMFNPDGSEAEMCGNGIRCFGKWVRDAGHTDADRIRVGTKAGIKVLDLVLDGTSVAAVRVDMGRPGLLRTDLPMEGPDGEVLDEPIAVDGTSVRITGVSMGNPHIAYFVDTATDASIDRLGPLLERHPAFPRRTNVHEVEQVGPDTLRMLTWERGAGRTLACGTGACAVAVAGHRLGRTGRSVVCQLPGGDLSIHWDEATGHVHMTGPAAMVFTGTIAW
ncbi:MAG: diaminopimelate epimerase [Armatimonadota bacterium]